MTLETLFLGVLAGYLIWRFYKAFDKKPTFPSDKIRLVSRDTGEVLEMQILAKSPLKQKDEWDEAAFLSSAKWAFQRVLTAFASADLKTLKNSLSPEVYRVFEQDISARKQKKQKLDFSLICFDSAKVVQQNAGKDEITVRFQTEQINLLKDENGKVIEGDQMSISTMTDTWIFKKISKESWLITATQSRMTPCVK